MDLSKLRALGNNYRDVRLISLRDWKRSAEIEPKDAGGPYIVVQEGYDPDDLKMTYDEFLLGRAGEWIAIGLFFKLPKEERRQEFVFGRAAEVIELLSSLTGKARVVNEVEEAKLMSREEGADDLTQAFVTAKGKPAPE